MASVSTISMGLITVLVVLLCGGANSQSGSCTNVIIGMRTCLNYITGNSSTPSSSCCSQLGNVVRSQPQCLCSVLNGGVASLGIGLNQTLALALPGACNVQTPPVSQCSAAGGPTTSPAGTPAASPEGSTSDETPDIPSTPSESGTPSGSGSKTIPSTNGSSSDGSKINAPLHLAVFVLFVLSCASTATKF